LTLRTTSPARATRLCHQARPWPAQAWLVRSSSSRWRLLLLPLSLLVRLSCGCMLRCVAAVHVVSSREHVGRWPGLQLQHADCAYGYRLLHVLRATSLQQRRCGLDLALLPSFAWLLRAFLCTAYLHLLPVHLMLMPVSSAPPPRPFLSSCCRLGWHQRARAARIDPARGAVPVSEARRRAARPSVADGQ